VQVLTAQPEAPPPQAPPPQVLNLLSCFAGTKVLLKNALALLVPKYKY
jgi:hypothetical protein